MEMKRNIIAVLAIVMVLCCVTLAACNDKNDTNVLDSYIFDMDGQPLPMISLFRNNRR